MSHAASGSVRADSVTGDRRSLCGAFSAGEFIRPPLEGLRLRGFLDGIGIGCESVPS